jgi:hypothetical protein
MLPNEILINSIIVISEVCHMRSYDVRMKRSRSYRNKSTHTMEIDQEQRLYLVIFHELLL